MCTLTIVPFVDDGARAIQLLFNRDEKRTRQEALPPRATTFPNAGVRAIFPTDPVGDGSWLALSEAGFAVALLNVNPASPRHAGRESRGRIVTRLAQAPSLAQACVLLESLDPRHYAPFRVVLTTVEAWFEIASNGTNLFASTGVHSQGQTLMRTSSSFGRGDEEVEGVRAHLWASLLAQMGDPLAAQEHFHGDRSLGGERSVLMAREDAKTVSVSRIVLRADAGAVGSFVYLPVHGDVIPV